MIRPVLVVEDDRKIARVVALYLEEAGYREVQADTGRKALDEAGRELPLLVVLHLMLPDMGPREDRRRGAKAPGGVLRRRGI